MEWYKASNQIIDNSTLRLVSKFAGVKHCETVATFHSLLERCAKNNSEIFADFDFYKDEISLQLDIKKESVEAIFKALEKFNIVQEEVLLLWQGYQAPTSTARVQKHRKKKKEEEEKSNVTKQNETLHETLRNARNVSETDVTKKRKEKNIKKNKQKKVSEVEEKTEKKEKKSELEIPLWIDRNLWEEFLKVRKSLKAVHSEIALKSIIKKLTEYKAEGYNPNEIILKSIRSSWKDVFKPSSKESQIEAKEGAKSDEEVWKEIENDPKRKNSYHYQTLNITAAEYRNWMMGTRIKREGRVITFIAPSDFYRARLEYNLHSKLLFGLKSIGVNKLIYETEVEN